MNILYNNVTFNGGFRFINMPLEARNKLTDISKKGKQIFFDFEKQGDVFLVTRDEFNYRVSKFIHENNLKFEFYPQINTKCGFDTEKPEELIESLRKYNYTPITTKTQLRKSVTSKIQENSPVNVKTILGGLGLDKNLSSKIIRGISVVNDVEFQRKIHISRSVKDNNYLVLIEPYTSSNPSKRYLVDSNGKIIKNYTSPDDIHKFYKEFKQTVLNR